MRKVALTSAAMAVLLTLVGVVSIAAARQAAGPSTDRSKTLSFDVVFSPFSFVPANPTRNANSPFSLGDARIDVISLFPAERCLKVFE